MSAETDEPETIGHMLTRLRLLVEDRADSELLRHVIIGRFEALEQERDGALASVAREAAGRREEAQRAADLADEIQRVREERDAAVAALAAERTATETSTAALRAELDALIAEIDRARRERTEVVSENLRVANVVVDMRARINQLQEENLLLKKQLSAQEAATLAAEQRASAVPSGAVPSDLLARLEEAERSASAWQEVASDGADELTRARYIIAMQASRLDDFQRHQPTEPQPPTQDSP